LESSSNNKEKEDEMYDAMMAKLLDIVLNPLNNVLTQPPPPPSGANKKQTSQWISVKPGILSQEKMTFVPANNEDYIHNILKWKIFTKKSRKKVLVEAMYL